MTTKQRVNCWNYEGVKYYLDITLMDCCSCGVTLAMPSDYEKRRREDHANFYCLNGHPQHFAGETAQEKKLRLAEASAAEERRAREATERSLTYARTALTAARDQATASERSKSRRCTPSGRMSIRRRSHDDDLEVRGQRVDPVG